MGVGDPVSIVEAVALGVDMFDCVLPTRLARHGTILTSTGRMNLRNARFARDPEPLRARLRVPDLPAVVAGVSPPPPGGVGAHGRAAAPPSTTCTGSCA